MKKFKEGKNIINFPKRLFEKIMITVLITIVFMTTGTLTFASTLYFTDGVHNGTSVTIGDSWSSNATITPPYGSGSTVLNGITIPYHIQHAWMNGGTGANHYAQINYDIGYSAWYWYWYSSPQASGNDGDKLTLDKNTSYTGTLHTRQFNNVSYTTNTSISATKGASLAYKQYGGRNVTLPTQSMKTCYIRFNGNGGTTSISSTSYTYSLSKYKCSTSSKYPLYTNVASGSFYNAGTSVVVPIASSYNLDNETATMTFTSYYNRPAISVGEDVVKATRPGYIFTGWNTKADGTGTTYSSSIPSKSNITSPDISTDLTLYAQWRPITYYVQYLGGGATSGTTENSSHIYDTAKNLNANGYTRYGYSFRNWIRNGTTTTYTNQQSVSNLTTTNGETINLTAQWDLIKKSVSGTINWNDEDNKYNSRPKNTSGIETVDVTLHSDDETTKKETGALVTPDTKTVVGENYSFDNLQTYKTSDNTPYIYSVSQNVLPGYETVINGYNITNNLILPTYTSNITYTPIDSFQNKLLKNGKVKVTGEVIANSNNRDLVGLNQGKAIFTIDSGISIDTNKIVVKYYDASENKNYNLTNYTLDGNIITAYYGKDANGISQKGDKIIIELEGTLLKLGQYSSNIKAVGNLRDYRGTNTTINLGEVTNTNKTIDVDYQLPKANLKIEKRDSVTEQIVTNAAFTLYEWDGTDYVQKEIIRDVNQDGIYESQIYEWNVITQGKYKVVENGVPGNYKDLKWSMEYTLNQLKTENYTVKPDYSNSQYIITYGVRNPDDFDNIDGIVENEPWKLKAKIEKIDVETKNTIQAETEFTIYEWDSQNNTYEEYVSQTSGNKVEMVRQEDKTYLSGEWLYYTDNNQGKYRIIETKSPEGYYANYDDLNEKITYDINIQEAVATGKFEDQTVENEGTVIISNNDDLTLTNKRQMARLNITLVDKETQGKPQGDSTLKDAKYGIYALEDIYHADGVTTRYENAPGLLYKKDELIQSEISNTEGKFTFDNLECGKYYIKMIEAPEGYLFDENAYGVDFTYQGETVDLIEANGIIGIQVKKQAFQIYKLKEDSTILSNAGFSIYLVNDLSIVKTGKISRITTERYSLNDPKAQNDERIKQKQNADGTYYLKDLVDYYYKIIYEEGYEQVLPGDTEVYNPYNLSQENKVKDYNNFVEGKTIEEIRTNDKGYMRSPELAYGEYIVIETSVPRKQDSASPFVVKIEQDSRDLQDIKFVLDNDFKSKIKIYMRDIETGNTILNKTIKYVIRNIDSGEYMTQKMWAPNYGYVEFGTPDKPFETTKTGYIITPMKLGVGQYELIQITAPEGYTTNKFEGTSVNGQVEFNKRDNVKFEINTYTAYYTDTYLGSYIIVVNTTNKPVVGDITIKSQGEFLTNASIKEDGNYEFEYTTRNVSKVKYQIIAKEDIYHQDNSQSKIYSKNEVVGYITTNEQGEGIIENLPLGKYTIKQVEISKEFALNTEEKEVEISYEGQEIPVVFRNVEQNETRQKIDILIHNKDRETNENRQGGKYGLYTKEDITYVDNKGNVQIIPADTLLATTTSNENGEIKFNSQENIDLPQGKYYVKEIEAPIGYVLQEQTVEIDTIKDNTRETVLKIEKELTGEKTSLTIKDITEEGNFVIGSKLEIVDKLTGEVIESWETQGKEEIFRCLKTDTQYIIRHTKPASGYVTADEVEFIIKTNGKLQINGQEIEKNIINIISRPTKLDIILKDKLDGSNVSNVKFKIVNKETNEEIVTFTMPDSEQRVEGLPIGKYILKEIELPENSGYVTNADVEFEVKDTKEVQKLEIIQSVSKLEIHILDELDNTKYAKGTKWQIISKVAKEDGSFEEKIVDEWMQDENKHEVKKLPIGNYILREVDVGENSGYVTNKEIEFAIKDTLEVQMLEVIQSVSKLEVHILDELDNTKYAKGTKWQIVSKVTKEDGSVEEKVVDEWTQDENKHEVKKLPIGHYVLREVEVGENSGYVTNTDVEFEIKDTLEVQILEVIQSVSKLEVHILDELDNTKYAKGTKWQIVSKVAKEDGSVEEKIVDEWIQDENKHEVKKLPIGNYILREVDVGENSGYVTNKEIEFAIKDTLEVQMLEVIQSVSKLEVHILDELDNTKYVKGTKWQIVSKVTKEDGSVEEKVVDEWIQDENKHEVKKLPIGHYILREIDVGESTGYVTNTDVEFEINDTLEVQKIEVIQSVSKLEVYILDELDNTKYAKGTKWQIVSKVAKEDGSVEEKIVDEWNQEENKHEVKKLPIGHYILREVNVGESTGYVTNNEAEFAINDTLEVQKLEIIQNVSKVNIKIVDIQTKENITDSVNIKIVNKETKEIIASSIVENNTKLIEKTEEGYYIEKLPIGIYTIIETSIDESKGYVEYQEVEMEVKDIKEVQKVEINQDISKLLIKVIDEETKEIIPEVKLQILDKETRKVIAKIEEKTEETESQTEELVENAQDENIIEEQKETEETLEHEVENIKENNEVSTEGEKQEEEKIIQIIETEEGYYIERLPIGEYILVQETKDGYHEVEEKQIKVENTKDKQEINLVNTRLKYDVTVEKQLVKIIFDGEETIVNNAEARKVEIKERKISTADLRLKYVIKVINSGETDIKVGTIVDKMPKGFELVASQSQGWTIEKELAKYKGATEEILKPGEIKEVEITTRWKNSITNFGDMTNSAIVENSSNPYGYEDKNKDNDEGKSIVVISVGTGIETMVTVARIVIVTFIGCMSICLIAGVEMLINKKRQK